VTLPAVERRITAVFAAWQVFRDWLRDYMKEQLPARERGSLIELCHFFRVHEWTEGEDGQGHPHWHVWIHGPFLDQKRLAKEWASALGTVTGEAVKKVVVDIREVTDGGKMSREGRRQRVVDELVKYMVKDLSNVKDQHFVDPVVYARVLLALTGRRSRQTSAGLSAHMEACRPTERDLWCGECGTVGGIEHRIVPDPLVRHRCEGGPGLARGRPRRETSIDVGPLPLGAPQFAFQI
jgi:hypothetical protein